MTKSIFFISLLFVFACAGRGRFYNDSNMSIRFGCGGGFSGEINGYRIDGDGKIYSYTVLSNGSKEYGSVEKSELKELDKMISEKGLYDIEEDLGGNMTCFIEIQKSGKTEKTFRWPMEKSPQNKKVYDLNNYLKKLQDKYIKK